MRPPVEEALAADAERDRLIAWNLAGAAVRGLACRFAAGRHGGAAAALPPPLQAAIEALAADFASLAARERRLAAELGAELVTLADPAYPEELRMLDLPPPAIYVQGEIPDGPRVAVVGSRNASPYGLEVAAWFGRELAAAGVAVVSGFAVGVDAAAHRGALSARGGRTVAVLGCGLDIDYPRGHRPLGERIAAAGARLTEYPCGRQPSPWQFPVRNRLIAALSDACVVIEAAPKSGSLSTARQALELGREVMAVPGRIVDELSLGTNALVADGARPALDPRDVLEAIGVAASAPGRSPADAPPGLEGARLALWRAAREQPAAPEPLAARAGVGVERALVLLLELELCGRLKRGFDGRYEAL